MLEADLKTVYTELLDEAGLSLAEEQKNFFDYLHFSPIKVRQKIDIWTWCPFFLMSFLSTKYIDDVIFIQISLIYFHIVIYFYF